MSLLFDFFSLDFIYYPVSWIMWVWYRLFAFVLGPSNFFAWALSVMFLVFTLRALLYKPFVRQIRTTRQMQELQPQIKALQNTARIVSGWRSKCKSSTRARLQPHSRMFADAGADSGVSWALSCVALV